MMEVTNADLRRWQGDAYRVLGGLLREDLPALDWRVHTHRSLVGYSAIAGRHTRAEIAAAWQAWVDYLGAIPWERQPPHEWHAIARGWGRRQINIGLVASFAFARDAADGDDGRG